MQGHCPAKWEKKIFLPLEENILKPDFNGKGASVQNKKRIGALLTIEKLKNCNVLGLDLTENNQFLSKLTL